MLSGELRCVGFGMGKNSFEIRHSFLGIKVKSFSMNTGMICALSESGGLFCEGNNGYGQLGNGTVSGTTISGVVPKGLDAGVKAVSVGDNSYACAVLLDGSVRCWGKNEAGMLADGTQVNSSVPVSANFQESVDYVVTGYEHACAVVSGNLYCWGSDKHGESGQGKTTGSAPLLKPTLVKFLPQIN